MILLLACALRGGPIASGGEESQPPDGPTRDAPVIPNVTARTHYLLAEAARERGDIAEAANAYKRAIAFDPYSPTLWFELSEARAELGEDDLAHWALVEAAENGHPEALRRLEGRP